jgi:hypothetical protein
MFSIGTIVVPTSTGLNWVGQVNKPAKPMFEPHVSCDVLIKLVLVQHVKIAIPLDTFQQHLP